MTDQFQKGLPLADLHLGPGGVDAAMAASPQLTRHVIEHGFADLYTNEALDQRARKLVTLASLVTSASLPQFEWHTRGALASDLLTKEEIEQLIIQMTIYIGYPAAYNAMGTAKRVFAEFDSKNPGSTASQTDRSISPDPTSAVCSDAQRPPPP
jgi:4-carboxymuconolactone decarboxylase